MLTANIHSLKLCNTYTETKNKHDKPVIINHSVTLVTAMNNVPENDDFDKDMPISGAQYVIKARKADQTYTTFRRDNNEEVNLLIEVLNNPDHSFYH